MNRLLIFLFIFFLSHSVWAQAQLLGHNLSPTTYTLRKGELSVGTYAAIYGVSDNLTLGASPWMYFDYNMYTAVMRYGKQVNEKSRIGGQLIYFKTDRESFHISNGYQMEAYSGNLTYSKFLNSRFTLHFNLNHMYFRDETLPFSLRREPFNDEPYQTTITMLSEIKATEDWGFLVESGILGLNYKYPQLIFGISSHLKFDNYLIQFGFNMTSTPEALFRGPRYDANNENGGRLSKNELEGQNDFSVHPEIQLQYTF